MPMIDADTHVDESEVTWKKLDGTSYAKYIPVTVTLPPDEAKRAGYNPTNSRCWVVEGRLQNRAIRDEVNHPPRVLRELEDVRGRLAHMDKMGVDVQVIFPTFFIRYNTGNAEAEWALTTTYNRWLAEKCAPTNGRLRWAAVLPLLNIDKAVEELRWAKDHGACGVFKKGIECGDRAASDPYFFPVYEEASRLDLPICIHNATGNVESATAEGSGLGGGMIAIAAFSALVEHGIPDMFPNLRVGFIETGASWVPYLYADLVAKKLRRTFLPIDFKEDLFRRNRFYVACQTNDDLPYILKYGTEDSLMIGTDYSHADQSAEIHALDVIEQRAEKGEIPASVARKILDDNPRRFYGL